jgi:hypothetical protein
MLIHEVPLHDVMVDVLCAMSAARIIGSIFSVRPYVTPMCYTYSDTIF